VGGVQRAQHVDVYENGHPPIGIYGVFTYTGSVEVLSLSVPSLPDKSDGFVSGNTFAHVKGSFTLVGGELSRIETELIFQNNFV